MRLKELVLQGFKSFADNTKLNFDDKFSVIVGPNGSGKSNISDAIRWVMGEQSAKSLRGGKMDDVIFSGTETRSSMNYARVTMVFDNEDGFLPIDYKEVNLTRKIYREGQSEYSINKQEVRLRDVRELFLDTGIGKEGYSIIGQGKIDEILSSKPEERRYIFDEAAGVSSFKYKKEESVRKLEKTEANLERIVDILSQMKERRDYLEKEAKKAKKGLEAIDELKLHQLSYLKKQIEELDTRQKVFLAKKDETLSQSHKIQGQLEELEETSQKDRLELSDIKVEVDKLELKLEKTRSKLLELTSDIRVYEERLVQEKSNFDFNKNQLDELAESKASLTTSIGQDQEKLVQKAEKRDQLRKLVSSLKSDKNKLEIEIRDNQQNIEELELELKEGKTDFEKQLLTTRTNQGLVSSLEEQIKKNVWQQERVESETLSKLEARDLLQKNLDGKLEELEAKEKDYQKLVSDSDSLRQAIDKLREIEGIEKAALSSVQSKLEILTNVHENYEGFYRPIQNLLRSVKDKPEYRQLILGTVADILEVEPLYRKAIELALGSQLQNIVIASGDDARVLINYLKDNNLGRISFLPLDRLSYPRTDTRGLEKAKYLALASDVVKVDDRFWGLAQYLLNRTIITENLEDALAVSRINNNNRLVTLDGDIVNRGGSMVGGSSGRQRGGSLIGRKGQIKEINRDKEFLEAKLQEIANKGNQLVDKFKGQLAINQDKAASLEVYREGIKEKTIELQAMDTELAIKKDQSRRLADELKVLNEKIEEIEDIEMGPLVQVDIENLEKDYRELRDQEEDLKTKLMVVDREILQEMNRLEHLDRDCSLLENSIANNQDLLSETSFKESRVQEALRSANDKAKDLRKTIALSKDQLKTNCQKVEKFQTSLSDRKELAEGLEKSVEEYRDKKLSLSQEKNDLDFKARDLEARSENLLAKVNAELEAYVDEFLSSRDELDRELDIIEPVETNQGQIQNLRKRVRDIGYFSYDSIEDFRDVDEEYGQYIKQKEDLIGAKEDILEIIKGLDRDIVAAFSGKFEEINENFNRIFSILFEGGKANLKLLGDDPLSAGVDFEVQPPGKRLRSLAQLSGGERALTAVALLFAIFETRPSPFCILDEVDAALDDSNISRYINYLRSFEDIQFLIISHRKKTMEIADYLYGVTMEEEGVSKVLSMSLKEEANV